MEQLDILLPRHTLEEALGAEMAKQARLRWGDQCRYMPVSDGKQYLCSCGCVNALDAPCVHCGQTPALMDRAVLEELRQEARLRLEEEAKEAARQEALRLQALRRQKLRKIRNACLWAAGGVAALAVAAAAFWGITRVAIPASHYQKALAALEKGDYRLSHREFTLAGDYEDAEAYLARFATPLLSSKVYIGNSLSQVTYSYDDFGRRLKSVEQMYAKDADGNWLETGAPVEYVQRYDEQGNQLVHANWNGHSVYVYNERNDVVQKDVYLRDGQHDSTHYFDYTYDESGRVVKKTEICSELLSVNNSCEYTDYFTYNAQGLVEEKITEANFPAQMENSYRSVEKWHYNEKGDPVEMLDETVGTVYESSDSTGRKTWVYDEKGNLLKSTDVISFPHDSGMDRCITATAVYDSRGRQLRYTTELSFPNNPKRNSLDEDAWEYDWEGKLVKEVFRYTYADENMQRYGGYTQTVTHTYDLLGRQTEYESVWVGPVESNRQKKTYEYGPDGMVKRMVETQRDDRDSSTVTYHYNENGLVAREEYSPSDPDNWSALEYTYAYFYYPEGTEKPQMDMISEVGITLYGA